MGHVRLHVGHMLYWCPMCVGVPLVLDPCFIGYSIRYQCEVRQCGRCHDSLARCLGFESWKWKKILVRRLLPPLGTSVRSHQISWAPSNMIQILMILSRQKKLFYQVNYLIILKQIHHILPEYTCSCAWLDAL